MGAYRFPGLVRKKGLRADDVRAACTEAGYLGHHDRYSPDAIAQSDVNELYQVLADACNGNRSISIFDQEDELVLDGVTDYRQEQERRDHTDCPF